VVAIVVPSLVLVVLSLRMISQERELTEKRLLDADGELPPDSASKESDSITALVTHLKR